MKKNPNIFIMPNLQKADAPQVTRKAIEVLHRLGLSVQMDVVYRDCFSSEPVTFTGFYEGLRSCDIVVAVGGDGTIIHSAKHALTQDKLVLGINAGRLGFLAQIEPNELENLARLQTGDYTVECRMLLEARVLRGRAAECESYFALNDLVFSKGGLSKMVDLRVLCDGLSVGQYRADGLIFATPTGSTAYSMSAGGPIVDPELESILMTPICPHSLFSRTILFSSSKTLELELTAADEPGRLYLTVDGEAAVEISPEDKICVKRSTLCAKFIHLYEKAFYETMNRKITARR